MKNEMKNKVNILGTEYTLHQDDSLVNIGLDGCCKQYDKEIRVRSVENMLEADDTLEVKKIRHSEVLRHEMIHAFFNESGLDDYANNEQLVDWIAVQFPKMAAAFKDVGCI